MEMQKFIGVKLIDAVAVRRDDTDGYKVRYSNGYESWTPASSFQPSHMPVDQMSFGRAFEAMRMGFHVRRACWDASSFLQIDRNENRTPVEMVVQQVNWGGRMRAFEWTPSAPEMLATDWKLLPPNPLVQQGSSLK
jgi:hypothetical protein